MTKVTRIAHSKQLNQGKYDQLADIAARLGKIRADLWGRYGALRGVGLHYGVVAKERKGDNAPLGLTYKLWKNTLKDVIEDIAAYRAAAKEKVKAAIRERSSDEQARIRLYTLLKHERWTEDPFLHRQMRKHYRHGATAVSNQIVIEPLMYTSFAHNGIVWLKVQTLEKGKRVALPTDAAEPFTGNLRLILKAGKVEIHYSKDDTEVCSTKPCGDATIGIDKGYTEAFTDSDGQHHGEGLGELLSNESDYLKTKYQRRHKLKAIAEKKPHKAANIERNNLGRKKLNRRKELHTKRVRDKVYKAAHSVVDKASTIAAEDLTSPIPDKKKYGKDNSRRLSGWVKGTMAEAINAVSQRRGSTLYLVNAAYTSQVDSRHDILLGIREGDRFTGYDGEVLDADTNAARNILARLYDNEIKLYTPYRQVRQILQHRTERFTNGGDRLRLDTSCKDINFHDPYQR